MKITQFSATIISVISNKVFILIYFQYIWVRQLSKMKAVPIFYFVLLVSLLVLRFQSGLMMSVSGRDGVVVPPWQAYGGLLFLAVERLSRTAPHKPPTPCPPSSHSQ